MSAAVKKSRPPGLIARHVAALGYVVRVVLPVILRTGRRPVIFYRFSGMGDILCTIPATRELIKRHPGATFIYNCHVNFADVPRLAGITDLVTSLEAIGLVGYWYRFLLGGYYHFAHNDDLAGKTAQEPMVTEFEKQFQLPVTGQHPEIQVAPAVREKVLGLLRQKNLDPARLVLLHPGPSWTIKEWPCEHWTQLVASLRAAGFTDIAQLGVGRYLYFGQVELQTIPGAVSLVDELSVEECFAAIGQAKLFIGIDSGLLHIAAAMRTPSVGIFGPTSPQFFYPAAVRDGFVVSRVECQGCYHRRPRVDWVTGCPHDIWCMKEISVETVRDACLKLLSIMPKLATIAGATTAPNKN